MKQKRLNKPSKLTQSIVALCTAFNEDQIEQLLHFRSEYRHILREYGRPAADRYARNQALKWMYYTGKEAGIAALILLGRFISAK